MNLSVNLAIIEQVNVDDNSIIAPLPYEVCLLVLSASAHPLRRPTQKVQAHSYAVVKTEALRSTFASGSRYREQEMRL